MNTPAHVLLASALAAKPDSHSRNVALICGALFPDLTIFIMVGWERWVNQLSLEVIFRDAYFSEFWQQVFAVNNSVPLFSLLLIVGLLLRREWLWAFALAAFLHVICDLPLHHDDGRPHFWPFTDWVYVSPVSYWDPRHHGVAAGSAEAFVSLIFAAILLRRFVRPVTRIVIGIWVFIELLFSVGGHLIYG